MMGKFQVMGAYTDHIIKPVLLRLSQESETVTYSRVAEETNIPYSTIKHSVKRMLEKGEISRKGKGRRWGYRYDESR